MAAFPLPNRLVAWAGLCLLGILIPGRGAAAETYAFATLRQPLTAQQTAWGGLSASGEGGAELLRANPAGLARAPTFTLGISQRSWQLGLQQHWVGAVVPAGSWAFAAHLAVVRAGELPAYDEQGNQEGSFAPLELYAGVGIARRLGERFRLGLTAHRLRLEGVEGSLRGTSFGVGLEAEIPGGRVGLALRNLGPNLESETGIYALPSDAAVGFEIVPLRRARFAATAAVDRAGEVRVHGGGAWTVPGGLSLLCGLLYRREPFDRRLSPRGGVVLDLRVLTVSYGYVPDGEPGPTHHISLSLLPGTRAGVAE